MTALFSCLVRALQLKGYVLKYLYGPNISYTKKNIQYFTTSHEKVTPLQEQKFGKYQTCASLIY